MWSRTAPPAAQTTAVKISAAAAASKAAAKAAAAMTSVPRRCRTCVATSWNPTPAAVRYFTRPPCVCVFRERVHDVGKNIIIRTIHISILRSVAAVAVVVSLPPVQWFLSARHIVVRGFSSCTRTVEAKEATKHASTFFCGLRLEICECIGMYPLSSAYDSSRVFVYNRSAYVQCENGS